MFSGVITTSSEDTDDDEDDDDDDEEEEEEEEDVEARMAADAFRQLQVSLLAQESTIITFQFSRCLGGAVGKASAQKSECFLLS